MRHAKRFAKCLETIELQLNKARKLLSENEKIQDKDISKKQKVKKRKKKKV